MAVTYKDIELLTQKSSVSGTEKLPVSDTQYITPSQIAASVPVDASLSSSSTNAIQNRAVDAEFDKVVYIGNEGETIEDIPDAPDTSDCVHITGDESVGGDKTFTDDIIIGDASNIKYGASSGEGFTKGYAVGVGGQATLQFSVAGEPKAFVVTAQGFDAGALVILGDSTGCRGVYAAASTYQHNYSTSFTASYSNGTLTITPPSGVTFIEEDYTIVYYYGSGTLTFKTSSVSPGSVVTSVTFTGTGLTETPAMYACLLETQVNSEQYRRVAAYTNGSWWNDYKSLGLTFYSQQVVDTTSSFSVSYNNGLVINSGGTNAGGYFHNPGTYTLYYLMASDIGGGSGSYSSLADELAAINTTIGNIETILASI